MEVMIIMGVIEGRTTQRKMWGTIVNVAANDSSSKTDTGSDAKLWKTRQTRKCIVLLTN